MKDYEKLSKKHFNNQAYEYDSNNSYYYSKEGKISSYHIEKYLKNKNFNSLLDSKTTSLIQNHIGQRLKNVA